jgi:hypothetical protein
MQGPIRAGSLAAPRDCRAQPAWLRGHSLPDKSRDTPADTCEARINRRSGSVTHNATAGANQLQRQALDRLGIDTYHDKVAAHREPVDHRRHRLRIGNGCQRSSLTAEAVECRRHVFGRIVNEMVNPEQARERLLVGAACPECSSNARRPSPGVTGSYRTLLGSEQNRRQVICREAVASMEDREKRTMPRLLLVNFDRVVIAPTASSQT